MKKTRLLIIGVLLAVYSGCFPVFIPEGGGPGGHGGHDGGSHGDHGRGDIKVAGTL